MRVSQFASIRVLVPPHDYLLDGSTNKKGILKQVGMAQNINVDDNFGSRAENVIGTPLPVLAPGYQITNIRLEKATIDGADFRNLGSFNPLWAHVGKTYRAANLVDIAAAQSIIDSTDTSMYPFMFVLNVLNRISNSSVRSNITYNNKAATPNSPDARSSSFGSYVCVLQSASISMTSQQSVVMDSVNAIARPISGTWFTDAIKRAYRENGDSKNGMLDLVTSVLFGYRS